MTNKPTSEEKYFECSDCGTTVKETDKVCPKCGSSLEETIQSPPKKNPAEKLGNSFDLENTAISALRFFAWLDLIAGVILSIIVWSKYANSDNPIAIGIGIAVLLQGLFVWALFMVLSSIALNLIAIKENTDVKKSK